MYSTNKFLNSVSQPDFTATHSGDNDRDSSISQQSTYESIGIDRPKLLNTYVKQLPIYFLSKQDWQPFIKYQNRKSIGLHGKQKLRMFISFNKLYKEYCFVCDNYLQNSREINTSDCSNASQHMNEEFKYSEKQLQAKDEKLPVDITLNNQKSIEIQSNYDVTNAKRSNLLAWFKKKFSWSKKHKNAAEVICSNKHHASVQIFIHSNFRLNTFHRIQSKSLNTRTGRIIQTWFHAPIILELALPKIQNMVETVLKKCPFVLDPLEALAELRFLNYNVEACIIHFHHSRDLREIIKEFSPSNPQLLKWKHYWLKLETIGIEQKEEINYEENEEINKNMSESLDSVSLSTVQTVRLTPLNRDFSTQYNVFPLDFKEVQVEIFSVNRIIGYNRKIMQSIQRLRDENTHLKGEISIMNKCFAVCFADYSMKLKEQIEFIKTKSAPEEMKRAVISLNKQISILKRKCLEEEKKRGIVYNMLQEHYGNIRVFCRCRNVLSRKSIIQIVSKDTLTVNNNQSDSYQFDRVFPHDCTQAEIYAEFQPLVNSFIDGYNVCFITYGGEATGKTFSLIGDTENPLNEGITQRSLRTILEQKANHLEEWQFHVSATVIEIYNDRYVDFLSDVGEVKLYIEQGLESVFNELKSVNIDNSADVNGLLEACRLKRQMAETALNPRSSRSHLLILIRLKGINSIHGEKHCSFLNLCDLAGFEDIVKADTQWCSKTKTEAGYINKSLTAFNRVFSMLKTQDPHTVPYRDTKLTHFLKPFLVNSGKCCILVTLRTDSSSLSCTLNTLRFSREAKNVALGKSKRQIDFNKL